MKPLFYFMTHPLIVWITFSVWEAGRHVHLIVAKKKSPNKIFSFLLRASVMLILILVFEPILIGYALVMYIAIGWWIHDYLINAGLWLAESDLTVREKDFEERPIWYLNDTGPIDRFQNAMGGSFAWFIMKSIIAAGSFFAYFINSWPTR